MFVTDRTIFLQLQKTGSMHICKLLAILVGGYERDRHCRLPADLDVGSRLIVSSIRDPWSWYLSLWSYGCRASMYGLRKRVTSDLSGSDSELMNSPIGDVRLLHKEQIRLIEMWRRVYCDANDPALFREWLMMVLDPERSIDLGENYGNYALHEFAGFLTHRYIMLHSNDLGPLKSVRTLEALADFDKDQNIVDVFIRNEHLEDDFIAMLEQTDFTPDACQIDFIRGADKTNAAKEPKTIAHYYDECCIDMVARKEAFIIDKHHYTKPIHVEKTQSLSQEKNCLQTIAIQDSESECRSLGLNRFAACSMYGMLNLALSGLKKLR